mmetsp:Transcript_25868/g.49165  ORF Transcript_25868/g.49165 Transcript_25868/m.49165 type:complete len:203 (-) Transcript_25868:270-878(-)|eukprot:CAMPEP_0114261242 /NCGR_PEP_ID=MMETSP0058-20121206/21010_1 /TAXON_ID=36894 /ORGANISM="Pyramimonas parkeae, CCMP726" /LENGTH=202 /DNA_ID=CAMNT_0001376719 /DNA_START=164 /DNA_END=772 /DNA_ORIENTATION=-
MDPQAGYVSKSLQIFPLSNYTIGTKDPLVDKHGSVNARMVVLKDKYEAEGMRRSVEAIVLVHEHNHPHILMLQYGPQQWRLPGGRLRPGEGEIEGLQRKLTNKLSPSVGMEVDWEISECAGTWWRPNFENVLYPYCPPHITRPKESKKLYVVQLSEKCTFAVPKNLKLLAVPLFELYDKSQRYGPSIATVPHLLSRFNMNMI